MNLSEKILSRTSRSKLLNNIFGLSALRARQIKTGPLKGLFFYGKYYDYRYFAGFFEKKIIRTIEKAIEPGNIYDIGSHFGFHSLIFARLAKAGKVYCFDPNPHCFERLKKTIELNKMEGKVEILNFGVGSENTEKEMMVLPDNLARSTFDKELKKYYEDDKKYAFQKIKVPLKSLDSLNFPAPVLIKIDVEGFELDAIKGMTRVLGKFSPDLVIEIHEDHKKDYHDKEEIIKILSDLNYACLHIEDNIIIKEAGDFSGGHIFASKNKKKITSIKQS